MKIRRWMLGALALAFVLGACDSTVDPDRHPTGAVLLSTTGLEFARYITTGGGGAQGELQANAGSTTRYRVVVLNHLSVPVDVDGEEYTISNVSTILPRVARATLQDGDMIAIQGVSSGSTTLRFTVNRHGQAEFIAEEIRIRVQ